MFLNPLLLMTGVAALAIPIYVHLQMRRKKVRVVFSSLRLIEQSQRIAPQRRKITNWPLFLLRCLVIALLAMVFARPLLKALQTPGRGRAETVVLVLDRSASLRARGAVGTAWDEAVDRLRRELKGAHPESRIALVLTPDANETAAVSWRPPTRIAAELSRQQPGMGRADLNAALGRAASALLRAENDLPKVLHLVSDLQADAIRRLDSVQLPHNVAIRVTKVGDLEPENAGLVAGVRGRDELRRGIYGFRGTGKRTTAPGAVELQPLDRQQQPTEAARTLPVAGDQGSLVQRYFGKQRGWHGRRLKLLTEDALAEDNVLFDSFYVQSRAEVLLIEPRIESESFNQATFFCSRALDPFLGESDPSKKATRFLPRVVSVAAAAQELEELQPTSTLVILPATDRLTQTLGKRLQEFVTAGGGLILFNGSEAKPEIYAQNLGPLLPVQIGEVEGLKGRVTVEIVTEAHPLWGGLDEASRRRMSRLPLLKRSQLERAADAVTLAKYSDGVPLVVRKSVGQGRVLFLNTTADRRWSDWQTQGELFVPTVHALAAQALPSSEDEHRNAAVQLTVEDAGSLDLGRRRAGQTVRIGKNRFRVDAEGFIRETGIREPGLVAVQSHAPETEADGEIVRQFAVNLPPEESDLDSVQAVVVQRQLESQRAQAGEEAALLARAPDGGSVAWKYLLAVLVLVLAAEPWTANRF